MALIPGDDGRVDARRRTAEESSSYIKMRSHRKVRTAAFQGEKGAFSQVAVENLLGGDVEPAPFQRFEEVFHALASGKVDAAVIPIENTLHGSVHENYD